MYRSKEEIEKLNGYLDKDKDRYFDGITPCFSSNIDEEGFFEDKNYSYKNQVIEKYINKHIELYFKDYKGDIEELKTTLRKSYKFKRLSKIIKEKEAQKNYKSYPYPDLKKNNCYYETVMSKIKKSENFKIIQGQLGDSFLISFLNGLREFQPKKFFDILGDCLFEIGYIEFNFYIEEKGAWKKVFVDDYILVNESFEDSPIFSKIEKPDNENIYGIFQLLEKALAKVLKQDLFVLDGDIEKTKYMKYLTGKTPRDINPKEISSDYSKELLANIIQKNIQKNNVLTCGGYLKELYNYDQWKDKKHMFTVVSFTKKKDLELRDPNEKIDTTKNRDNNIIIHKDNNKVFLTTIKT